MLGPLSKTNLAQWGDRSTWWRWPARSPPSEKKRIQTVHSETACSVFFSLFFCIWSAIKEVHDANDAFWNHFQPIVCLFLFSSLLFWKGSCHQNRIWFRSFSSMIFIFLFVKKCFHNKRERLHLNCSSCIFYIHNMRIFLFNKIPNVTLITWVKLIYDFMLRYISEFTRYASLVNKDKQIRRIVVPCPATNLT